VARVAARLALTSAPLSAEWVTSLRNRLIDRLRQLACQPCQPLKSIGCLNWPASLRNRLIDRLRQLACQP
jgi:hypothetical protein